MEAFRDRAYDALQKAAVPTLDRILADAKIEGLPEQVRRLLVYLHIHLFDLGLNVKTWRLEAKVRDNSVPALFRTWLGVSLGEYLRDRRIETAARMLAATDLEELRIGRAVGYPYYRTFENAFVACTGRTPEEGRDLPAPEFDVPTLRRALRGELEPEKVERLIGELRRHYPEPDPDASTRQDHGAPMVTQRKTEIDGGEYELFRAERVWQRIRTWSFEDQKREIRRYVFHSTVFFDLLRQKSRQEGRKDRRRGVELAELALVSLEEHEEIFGDRIHELRALGWAWLANARRLMLDFDGAEADFGRTDDEWSAPRAMKDLGVGAEIQQLRSALRMCQRRYPEALEYVEVSIRLSELVGDVILQAQALIHRASVKIYTERLQEGASDLQDAADLIDDENEPFLELKICLNQANVHLRLGDHDAGIVFLEKATSYCTQVGSDHERYEVHFLKGGFSELSADSESAEKAYIEALEGFLSLNEANSAALVSLHLAMLYSRERRSRVVLDLVSWSIPILQSMRLHEETTAAIELLARESTRTNIDQFLLAKVARLLDLDPLMRLDRQTRAERVSRPSCLRT